MSLFDNIKKVGEKAIKDITSEETKEKAKALFDDAVEASKKAYNEIATEENKEKAKAFLNSVGEKIGEASNSVKEYVSDAINDGEEKPEVEVVPPEDETPCE